MPTNYSLEAVLAASAAQIESSRKRITASLIALGLEFPEFGPLLIYSRTTDLDASELAFTLCVEELQRRER